MSESEDQWPISPAEYDMRRRLRKLHDDDPESFSKWVGRLIRAGDKWRDILPEMEAVRGKVVQVNDLSLALLLADYELAQVRKVTREAFLDDLVKNGCAYGNPYFRGTWGDKEAVRTHLSTAQKKVKSDATFALEVEFWKGLLEAIRYPHQPAR